MSKIKVAALILICIILSVTLFGCGNAKADVLYIDKSETPVSVSADVDKSLFYSGKTKNEMTKIAKSDMTALFFDESNFNVCVYDLASKKLWRSLPEEYAGVKTGSITLDVLAGGNSYTLDSQSDSVAVGLARYEAGDNFVKITYGFESEFDGKKLSLGLPVTYTLQNGTLEVEIDCASIEQNGDEVILKGISILPYFGASASGGKGDYILVPDGTGAIIDLSKKPETFDGVDVAVYGSDYSKTDSTKSKAVIGAFGMKSGNSSFVAVIESGAGLATIKARKALTKSGYNSVGAYFEITPTAETENGKIAVSKESFNGKIKLSYRFLSSQSADYIGMAGAVRELLMRNGSLPMNTGEVSENYPFTVSLIGKGYNKAKGKTEILTSYSQAYDILTNLKAKGVSDIRVRYRGIFDGGVNQHDITGAEIALGKERELDELTDYAKNQSIRIFADVNLVTASTEKSFGKKAVAMQGSYAVKSAESFQNKASNFLTPSEISSANNSVLKQIRKTALDGICLADAGKYLFSDFSASKTIFRTETADIIANESAAIASNKALMVDTGNLYSVKYATSVVNLPASASCKNNELCTQVPFVQAVLHGTVEYSLTPINTANVSETMFLRYVEYGAVPYFEWYYADSSDNETADKYCYLNSISDAQLYYARMANSLSDLRNARITGHERVKKNVYLTEYDNSTKIYVNYNKTAVTVGGVTVEPRSFVRVN